MDKELLEELETKDVSQKRYIMFKLVDQLLEEKYPDTLIQDRIEELESSDGYLYKLVQDFLLSSSTMEKEEKFEKIVDYF